MQKKKSRFWLFIWSLVPGAGEMYLGFMKMGLSLMLGFALLIMVAVITNLGALAVFPVVMYVFSFFHANNLGALNDAEFYGMKDEYLFGMEGLDSLGKMGAGLSEKHRKIGAVVLIVIGIIMLWQTVFNILYDIFGWDYLKAIYYFTRDDLPRIVIGIAIIWGGIVLIRGKKADYTEEEQGTVREQNVSDGQNNTNGQTVSVERNGSDSQNNQ